MIFNDLLNLIFPSCCYNCDEIIRENKYICQNCFQKIKETNYHKSSKSNELYVKLYKNFDIEGAFSMYYYEEGSALKTLIHYLKYKNKKNIGIWLGEIYGKILKENNEYNFDYIIPVPLHKNKEQSRGYNQSKMIAKGLNKHIPGVVSDELLIKIKDTEPQTTKNKEKRRQDIINSFNLAKPELLNNKRILLVDDIITTCSTIKECIKTIKKTINCKITICSIGRTIPKCINTSDIE